MNQTAALLSQIQESFREAAAHHPAYGQLLPFYENLYQIQESAVAAACPEGLDKAERRVGLGNDADAPLLDQEDLPIDMESAKKTLRAICQAAGDANPTLARAGDLLDARLDDDASAIEDGFVAVGKDDRAVLEHMSSSLGIEEPVLYFFLSHSVWPSLARFSRTFTAHATIGSKWQHRYCPVCGGAPSLAYLADDGKRFLVCGLCRHQWASKRILCPHCGNDETDTLTYFFGEAEPAYRVYTCERCKDYIKTIDTRQLARPFYPPLEDLMTLHLDLRAVEMGYRKKEDSLLA